MNRPSLYGACLVLAISALSSCGGTSSESQASAPAAPEMAIATASDGKVTLNWTAVSEATSYNIYWKTAAGVTKGDAKIANATSPYEHGGLTNEATYYYAVTAVNSSGESGLSIEVSATPKVSMVDLPPDSMK